MEEQRVIYQKRIFNNSSSSETVHKGKLTLIPHQAKTAQKQMIEPPQKGKMSNVKLYGQYLLLQTNGQQYPKTSDITNKQKINQKLKYSDNIISLC